MDIPISQDVRDILGPGDFLLRDYQDPANGAEVDLFIAYFPSQRSGDAIHSPKNCLPGAGWVAGAVGTHQRRSVRGMPRFRQTAT